MRLLKFLVIAIAVICGQTVSAQSVKNVHVITELKADTTLVLKYPKGEIVTSFVVQFTAANPQAETKEERVCLWETPTAAQAVVIRDVPGNWEEMKENSVSFLAVNGKRIRVSLKEKE